MAVGLQRSGDWPAARHAIFFLRAGWGPYEYSSTDVTVVLALAPPLNRAHSAHMSQVNAVLSKHFFRIFTDAVFRCLARTHKENVLTAEFIKKVQAFTAILVRSFVYVKSFLSITTVCNASALAQQTAVTMVTSDAMGVVFLYD